MKKIALLTLVFITSFAQAQEKMQSKQRMHDYTPEEMAQVQTKQLTLDLDLNEAQQKQVETLFLENAKTRKAKMEQRNLSGAEKSSKASLSKEEKLTMKNESLEQQKEMKAEMKQVLSKDQYAKWEKLREERKSNHQMKMQKKKRAQLSEEKE